MGGSKAGTRDGKKRLRGVRSHNWSAAAPGRGGDWAASAARRERRRWHPGVLNPAQHSWSPLAFPSTGAKDTEIWPVGKAAPPAGRLQLRRGGEGIAYGEPARRPEKEGYVRVCGGHGRQAEPSINTKRTPDKHQDPSAHWR